MKNDRAELEIQKRHTLNWLIQGTSAHACLTVHHLVRNELNALDPALLRCYDHISLLGLLQYWHGLSVLLSGWPPRFWRKAASNPGHPFFGHPTLSKYGGMLAEASRRRALDRCKEKGFSSFPVTFSFKVVSIVKRLRMLETPHREELCQLARRTTAGIWGFPAENIDAELSDRTVFPGDIFPAQSFSGHMLRACVVGYGGVTRRDGQWIVAGKGITWPFLVHELFKGTAELVCMHGLSQLDDATYQRVISVTDRIDLEPWMLQSGGELWRRLLAVIPDDLPIAKVLMHLARLPAASLEEVVAAVIEQPSLATDRIANLGKNA